MTTTASPKIISHRGGVVGTEHAENGPAALEAAVDRGYWMIEVDVRETRDLKLVVQHDPDFTRYYGDPRLATDMTWQEIAALRAEPDGTRPLQFHELAALAKGRLQLMIDAKPKKQTEGYFEEVRRALDDNDLLVTAYVINTRHRREWVASGAWVGLTVAEIEAAAESGEDVTRGYFVFEHGRDLTTAKVERGRQLGAKVVPTINVGHYADLPDHMSAAEADMRRMLALDVDEFQIDSVYDHWLR